MRKRYTVEELTCPDCGFVAVNANGLRGHRQFKHGVRPSGAQLPLQKQDLLISESKLAELLDERFAVISEQMDMLNGDLVQQGEHQVQLAGVAKDDGEAIAELQKRLSVAERKTIDDFSPVEKAEFLIPWLKGLNEQDFFTLAKGTGHDVVHDPAVVTMLAETFPKQAEEPNVVKGKVDEPGWSYLETMDVSIRKGARGMPEVIKGKTKEPGYKYLENLNLSIKGE